MPNDRKPKADSKANSADDQNATASRRLGQLNGQLQTGSDANTSRRRTKAKASPLPADWSDVLGELDKIRKLAATPKSDTTGYIRHKMAGKLWVRERIELLLDKGSFKEVGSAAGTATWKKPTGFKATIEEQEKEVVDDFLPSNNVQGQASVAIVMRDCLLTASIQALERSEGDKYY